MVHLLQGVYIIIVFKNQHHTICFPIGTDHAKTGYSCCNSDSFQSLEWLHRMAARLVYDLTQDIESSDVPEREESTLFSHYKPAIFICIFKAYHDKLPNILDDNIIKKRVSSYSTRKSDSGKRLLDSSSLYFAKHERCQSAKKFNPLGYCSKQK